MEKPPTLTVSYGPTIVSAADAIIAPDGIIQTAITIARNKLIAFFIILVLIIHPPLFIIYKLVHFDNNKLSK